MKVLVYGSGGRDHCLADKYGDSQHVDKVYFAPGNPGVLYTPKGKRGLSLELRQKGINPKIIAQALAKISEKQLLASAQKIITPKLKLYKNLPKIKLKQKLIGFLSRRGFSWEIIKSVVDEAMLKL